MKKKANIVPPSKKIDSTELIESRLQRVHRARKDLDSKETELKQQLREKKNASYYEAKYPACLAGAAQKLDITYEALDQAFSNNKGALVKEFNTYSFAKKNYKYGIPVASVTAVAAGSCSYLGFSMDLPLMALPAILSAFCFSVGAGFSYDMVRDSRMAKKSIYKAVTSNQNRLPNMAAPKTG